LVGSLREHDAAAGNASLTETRETNDVPAFDFARQTNLKTKFPVIANEFVCGMLSANWV